MATLRNLIDEFGASGCVREDREAVVAYQTIMQAEMPFFASEWIDGGNDIILTLTPDSCLVLTGAGGTLAVLDDLSAASVEKMKKLNEARRA